MNAQTSDSGSVGSGHIFVIFLILFLISDLGQKYSYLYWNTRVVFCCIVKLYHDHDVHVSKHELCIKMYINIYKAFWSLHNCSWSIFYFSDKNASWVLYHIFIFLVTSVQYSTLTSHFLFKILHRSTPSFHHQNTHMMIPAALARKVSCE